MKDIFNRRQRFSLRKYSVGVCSVLLGTALFAAGTQTVLADEVENPADSSSDVISSEATSDKEIALSKPVTGESSAPTSYNVAAVVQPSVATDSQHEGDKEAGKEATAEPTETVSREATGTSGFRNSGEVTSRVVSNWNGFVSALNDNSIQNITISGNVVATGDNGNTDNGRVNSVDRTVAINSQGRNVVIQGRNDQASLDLLSNSLKFTGSSAWNLVFKNLQLATGNSKGAVDLSSTTGANTVTFENVKSQGSSLYGGGGNTDVIVKGETSSTVSDSYRSANGQTQYVQRNVGSAGHSVLRREANIHDAKSVTVADGASLTLNRSSQGDGINLAGGSTVRVNDGASLTINMNTNNGTESARYHNAGIFMEHGGTVVTGKDSKLTLNTSIGQAISLGMGRPADGLTHLDRWGGYGTGNAFRRNGKSSLTIGEHASFNFTGRDGLVFGNNATFTTGENSRVRFENKGRGTAIDFGDNSRVVFGKKSTNTFHSVGKGPKSGGGPSGSYNAYNYIGLNENGSILVDDYATFRVQMDNRGANPWDDVINLDSKHGWKDQPLFQANKGSIVDVRDDNTDYYAELISVPLGASTNVVFQFNNPLYVSFMRYTNSEGRSAGEITGKLPFGIAQGNNPEQIGHGNILYISNGSRESGNHIEFNGPTGTRVNRGAGTYTVYSLNRDGRDVVSKNRMSSVWTDIQGGAMSIAGFKPGGKPEINPSSSTSVQTGSSSGGVLATDKTYGIDPVTANRQNIWVSNGTSINPHATHTNTIRYVYEDGSPVLDANGKPKVVVQTSDWKRLLEVAIDQDQFKKVLKSSSVANGDEFLAAYGKTEYIVRDIDGDGIGDTGWQLAGTTNSKATYDTVVSPEVEGYKAEILSTNVPGLAVGTKASRVTVTFNPANIKDDVVVTQGGRRTVSETYWRNIVDNVQLTNYETVVVYKQDKQKASVKYVNVTSNIELAKDEMEGRGGALIEYSTADRISAYKKAGYRLLEDGFTNAADKHYDTNVSVDQEFVVTLEERIEPVTPQDPKPVPGIPVTPEDPASWPKEVKDMKELERTATQTIRFREEESGKEVFKTIIRKVTFERTAYVNLVTGHIDYSNWRIGKVVNEEGPVQPVGNSSSEVSRPHAVAPKPSVRSLKANAHSVAPSSAPTASKLEVSEVVATPAPEKASVSPKVVSPTPTTVVKPTETKAVESPAPLVPGESPAVEKRTVVGPSRKAPVTANKHVYVAKPVLTRGRSSRRPPKV